MQKKVVAIVVLVLILLGGGYIFARRGTEAETQIGSYAASYSHVPLPSDLEQLVLSGLEHVDADFEGSGDAKNCAGTGRVSLDDYSFISSSGDLNNDGVLEYEIWPVSKCDPLDYTRNLYRGANGNGPILIYGMIDGVWKQIGDLVGEQSDLSSLAQPTLPGVYSNLVVGSSSGPDCGVDSVYQWNPGEKKYQEVSQHDIGDSEKCN